MPKLAAAGLRTTHMIMNTEWGGFAGASLPRLPADAAVDAASVNPGAQAFEKLVSGLYLGRIVAAIALAADAEAAPPALDGAARDALARPDAVPTPLVSRLWCVLRVLRMCAICSAADMRTFTSRAAARRRRTMLLRCCAMRWASRSRRPPWRCWRRWRRSCRAAPRASPPPAWWRCWRTWALRAPPATRPTRRRRPPSPSTAVRFAAHLPTRACVSRATRAGLFEHHTVFAAQLRAAVAEMGVAAQMRLTPDGSGVGAALLAAAASRA